MPINNIPLIDLHREYAFLKKELSKRLRAVFSGQKWILGPEVDRFEEESAEYLNVKYAVGVASGTDALLLSLRAISLKLRGKEFFSRKDEIITTPFTFISTGEAILRAGATPVFVDINPDTFNIAPEEVAKVITKNTVGIIPVHLYGLPADMALIMNIAREHNLFVLEDAAQAFGAVYKGRKAGTIGTAGCFSFFPSKNLGGYGDGGLVATNDRMICDYVRILRNHGQKVQYRADYSGYNSRLDSFQASVLSVKLKYIDKFNELRRKAADMYEKGLENVEEIKTPSYKDGSGEPGMHYHIYHLYAIKVFSKRNGLLKFLSSKGINARVYYPVLLNQMKAFSSCKVNGILKNAEEATSNILALPMGPFLKSSEINYVVKSIKHFFTRG